jgi:Arc/MetJ family transcription regulator
MFSRTNIVLDDKLVRRAMKKAGVKTKREAVEAALQAFVREADHAAILALRGSGGVADGYDPKAYAPSKWSVHEP